MGYCSKTDLEARISQTVLIALTDDERSATSSTTLDAAIALNAAITVRLAAAIVDADALIDSYIRKAYAVPLATTPPQIARISADLASYFLHCRRRGEMGVPDEVRRIYKDAIAYLEGVNEGRLDLGLTDDPAQGAKVIAHAASATQNFTADSLKEF